MHVRKDLAKSVTDAELDEIVLRLRSRELIAFDPSQKGHVPAKPGLYAIHRLDGPCLHAGQSANLRSPLFVQHYQGGGKKAQSDLVQKVVSHGMADGRISAQHWIIENCAFRWLDLPDTETRHWGEHRLLSSLRPLWCVPNER